MPSPDSYDFVYVVNAFAGDGSTSIGGANAQTVTLTDSIDGSNNNSTAVAVSQSSFGSKETQGCQEVKYLIVTPGILPCVILMDLIFN